MPEVITVMEGRKSLPYTQVFSREPAADALHFRKQRMNEKGKGSFGNPQPLILISTKQRLGFQFAVTVAYVVPNL